MGLAFEINFRQNLQLLRRQKCKVLSNLIPVANLHQRVERRVFIAEVINIFRLNIPTRLGFPAQPVDAAIPCNRVNPGAGRGLAGIKTIGFTPNLDHGFLGQFFCPLRP